MPTQRTILVVSGSLRANSSTHVLIEALRRFVPDGIMYSVYDELGQLPHFDDAAVTPPTVTRFRTLIKQADGVLICTPEYAFGVPGSLKNALDWTVSSAEFMNKPVALITAATGGDKAHASLLLTLGALSASVHADATLLISFVRAKLDKEGNVKDAGTVKDLHAVLNSLIKSISHL